MAWPVLYFWMSIRPKSQGAQGNAARQEYLKALIAQREAAELKREQLR
jgi:hypothetical protein